MAKKINKFLGFGIATQSVHTGTDYDAETGAVRRPLHMANSYKLPDDLARCTWPTATNCRTTFPGSIIPPPIF